MTWSLRREGGWEERNDAYTHDDKDECLSICWAQMAISQEVGIVIG